MERFDETSADLKSGKPKEVWVDRESISQSETVSGSAKFGHGRNVDSLSANVETSHGYVDKYSIDYNKKGARFESPLGVATFDFKGNIVVEMNPPRINEAGSFTSQPQPWE